jgi:hypothetical protein
VEWDRQRRSRVPRQFGFFGWREVELRGARELGAGFSPFANTVWTGFRSFLFLRHPAPQPLFQAIETDGNFAGNRGTISGGMGRYSSV